MTTQLPTIDDLKQKYNNFIDNEVKLNFLTRQQGERLKWYYETYFLHNNYLTKLNEVTLPTDDEINKMTEYIAHNYFDMSNTNHYQGLKEGAERMAKWMTDRIKK